MAFLIAVVSVDKESAIRSMGLSSLQNSLTGKVKDEGGTDLRRRLCFLFSDYLANID